MNLAPVWLRCLLCLALAAGCSGAGRRDAAITERVRSVMEGDPIVQSPDLAITTRAGVVTLEGEVPDEFAHLRALEIVRQTPGVVQVVDRLRTPSLGMPAGAPVLVPRAVRASLPAPRPEPVPAVERAAAPAAAPELVPARTSEIELEAAPTAPSERDAARAEPPPEPPGPAADGSMTGGPDLPASVPALDFPVAMSPEDAAISVDVRARIEEVAPNGRIQVATRRGVVILSGAVDTELEKSQVLHAARSVPGVERVEDRILVLRP